MKLLFVALLAVLPSPQPGTMTPDTPGQHFDCSHVCVIDNGTTSVYVRADDVEVWAKPDHEGSQALDVL